MIKTAPWWILEHCQTALVKYETFHKILTFILDKNAPLKKIHVKSNRPYWMTNEYCKIPEVKPMDKSENSRSLGVLIDFGKLRILDLGDLTWDKEMQFMCPVNRIGRINILVVSHHGMIPSSSHALVDAIHPRVAIMDNGATKGGSTPVLETINEIPGLETLWQLHYSEQGGTEHNTGGEYIANLQGPDQGNYLVLTASPTGSFTVFNSRTNSTKTYPAR